MTEMIKKIRNFIINTGIVSTLLVPTFGMAVVHAQPAPREALCGGATGLQIESRQACEDPEAEGPVNNLITSIINIFSVVVGIIAVIMIIFGGFRYITSGGDSGNISSAKQTIIYAVVGLIIVALAQVIVRFVLFRATTGGEGAA